MTMVETAPMTPAAGRMSPRSPTLSCADMILPESDVRSFSPSPYMERSRPPSPPSLLYKHSNRSAAAITLASAPQNGRGLSSQTSLPQLSSQSSRSTLRSMPDSDGSSTQSGGVLQNLNDDALASSPTITNQLGHDSNGWDRQQQRRLSDASSSIHSEDLENWPAFDGPGAFDDSGVVLEEDEERDQFPDIGREGDDLDDEKWLDEGNEDDGDEYSSAALSKRAEMILANAKKRLNVMEGNLRGARQSLVASPTLNSNTMESALSHQLAAARDRDRRLYAGHGPIPPRTKYYTSQSSSKNSPGHARGMSETSASVSLSQYTSRMANKRASSAMGTASGPWSPEGYGHGRFPIRESRSFEVVRDHEERDASLHSYESRGSRSPPNTLETLPEDEDPQQNRPSSIASDLRNQMQDLRGRISSLKQKAKEDHMRRQSLQSLRTQSPFTCAETWYAGDGNKPETSPVTADAGVGTKIDSPVRKALFGADGSDEFDVKAPGTSQRTTEDQHQQALDFQFPEDLPQDEDQDSVDGDDNDFVSVEDDDGLEPAGDSVYEDAVYDFPVAERHEDRVDAFDYEHFFLHSAMGTYSQASRRTSTSSADSVETTRPLTALIVDEVAAKRVSMHQRNSSVDSVSTVATFATAAEEQSDDEEENEKMDQFSQQLLYSQHPVQPHYATVSDGPVLAVDPRRSDSAMTGRATVSRSSSSGSDLEFGLQTSKIYTILMESPKRKELRLALNEEEKQLIYGLAASLQMVCGKLQSMEGGTYERKEWRRRLDEARRVLCGEDGDVDGGVF